MYVVSTHSKAVKPAPVFDDGELTGAGDVFNTGDTSRSGVASRRGRINDSVELDHRRGDPLVISERDVTEDRYAAVDSVHRFGENRVIDTAQQHSVEALFRRFPA